MLPNHIILSSSFLLSLEISPEILILVVEAALDKNHPHYSVPKVDEAHCFERLIWKFEISKWYGTQFNLKIVSDSTGQKDFGGIEAVKSVGNRVRILVEAGSFEFIPSHFEESLAP